MTARYLFSSILALGVLVPALPALAGWTPDGATIKATTAYIPEVAAVNDGGYGTFVVWQEEATAGSGVVRAQHVLASGDVDPAWPADGLLVCDVSTARGEVGVVADGLGGAYTWWKEGAAIYLSRFDATGGIAAGWPARGRSIGATWPATARPSVIPDGANGIYLGWPTYGLADDPFSVRLIHLGPDNTGAGGWPNSARAASGGDPVATYDWWPRLALASDGGVFVAWAEESTDEQVVPTAFRLRRLTSAGLNASGWPSDGLVLGSFDPDAVDSDPETGLLGLSDDGAGGVFAQIGVVTEEDGWVTLDTRLQRRQGDGTTSPGWPEAGLTMSPPGSATYWDVGLDASLQVLPDGLGGAQAGAPDFFDHGTGYHFSATLPEPVWKGATAWGTAWGIEVVRNANGGVFMASFDPQGPFHIFDANAFLNVVQSLGAPTWTDFSEYHSEPTLLWYGDIGLAGSGDGGAVFFWSQVRERFGLFARRFNGAGQVTDVGPRAPVAALALDRLRFVAGEGVRAALTLPSGESGRIGLYDLTGRRVGEAALEAEAGGAREITIAGTRTLASGIYFLRVDAAGASRSGKVVVTR